MLVKMWRDWGGHTLLVACNLHGHRGKHSGSSAKKLNMELPYGPES